MDKFNLLKIIYAKYNELDSLKKYVKDDVSLTMIEAKQDTLSDLEKAIKGSMISL